nr:hypothetical protein [uncultured Rhodoferax sp.]
MTTLTTTELAQLSAMRAQVKSPRFPEPIRKRACANALRIAQARV